MTPGDIRTLAPLLTLAAAALAAMAGIAWRRSHALTVALTGAGLATALALLAFDPAPLQEAAGALLVIDGQARFFMALFMGSALAIAMLAPGFLVRNGSLQPEEFYILLLLATVGASVLAASRNFVPFFLGLELLSVSLYALIAYLRRQDNRVEAGIKYLVLAGVSAAFLFFGMALVYAETGTLDFGPLTPSGAGLGALGLFGVGGILVGIAFKLALVPFHLWTPDVYEGAPLPTMAYVATVSKGAMFALLLRLLPSGGRSTAMTMSILAGLAILSMLVGNLLALLQSNVKRLLAYSSIAHLGYLLVAFLAGGESAGAAIRFYFIAYFAAMLGAVGVMVGLSSSEREAGDIEDYRGLFWRRPWPAAALSLMFFSLAGIPLTAGFIAKFYVLLAAVGSLKWLMAMVLVISSGIGLFYYLRVIIALFSPSSASTGVPTSPTHRFLWNESVILILLVAIIVGLGVCPEAGVKLATAFMAP